MTGLDGRPVTVVEELADRLFNSEDRKTKTVTVYGTHGVLANLENAGIALVRVTATDVIAVTALREHEDAAVWAADWNRRAYTPHQFAELAEGDLAAVTRNGDVHRINPDKIGDAKAHLGKAKAHFGGELPSVIDVRTRFEIEGEEQTALYAEKRTETAAKREAFARSVERRRLVGTIERTASGIERETRKEIGTGIRAGFGLVGGLVKGLAALFEGLLGGGEPTLTKEQAQRTTAAMKEQHSAEEQEAIVTEKEARRERLLAGMRRQQSEQRLDARQKGYEGKERELYRDL